MRYRRGISVSEDTEKLNRKWRSIAESFNAKECNSFIPKKPPNQNCCECGRQSEEHPMSYQPIAEEAEKQKPWFETWSSATHTRTFPTNAFGVMEFQGVFNTSRAKYVRLSDETSENDVLKLLTDLWNLKLPKLLIEVTGGAKDFVLNPKLKRIFYDGIIRVAVTADAWILTGGTNTGVMKYVGKAIREHSIKSHKKIVAIGVASWGIVDHREDLIVSEINKPRTSRAQSRAHSTQSEIGHCLQGSSPSQYQEGVRYYRVTSSSTSSGASLDPNHSHFILVDNGTVKKYGVEISLRSKLEKLISKQTLDKGERCIPAVCIVLEGGINTIQVVFENVTSDPPIPVVIAEGSGRAADILAFAYSVTKPNGEISKDNRVRLMDRIKDMGPYDAAERLIGKVLEIVTKKELLTVFSVDSEVSAEGLDNTILQALVKANNLPGNDQLQLALLWNRVDIAREKIFKLDKTISEEFLNDAMMQALKEGKPDFVKLLLENGVSMHTFLTEDTLVKLYEDSLNTSGSKLKLLYSYSSIRLRSTERGGFCVHHVGRLVDELIGNAFKSTYTTEKVQNCRCQTGEKRRSRNGQGNAEDECLRPRFMTPFSDLFIWAILSRKHDMAYLMWQQGTEALAKAIIAIALYSAMSRWATDQFDMENNELDAQANRYKEVSYDILQVCFEQGSEYTRQLILVEMKHWSNETIISLAAAVYHSKLIGHPCVQTLLTDQWIGKLQIISNKQVLLGLLFPPVIAMLSYREVDVIKKYNEIPEEPTTEDIIAEALELTEVDDETPDTKSDDAGHNTDKDVTEIVVKQPLSIRQRYYAFYTAPIVKFWSNTLFYVTFLITFSYMVLIKLPDEYMRWMGISIYEWIVMFFVFSLATEEIRQVVTQGDALSWKHKLKSWSSDAWNIWDAICIAFFFIGFFMRIKASLIMDSEETINYLMQWGRLFYCFDIIFWYIRMLDVLSVSKLMGPYVKMIGRMMVDMLRFTIILGVFVTSYGVASHGIMKPTQKTMDLEVIKDVFYQPYWHVYGELFLDERNPNCETETCVNGSMLVPLIMAVYLLFANILLINMLIAIFNNTFISVQQNALEIWKFQRYRIILEFRERPLFSPPFIVISHVWQIGKEIFSRLCRKEVKTHKMKLHLTDSTQSVLYSFEESCVEIYLRRNVLMDQSSQERTIQRLEERLDKMDMKFAEHMEAARKFNKRFKLMEDQQERTLESVREVLHMTMETYRLSDAHAC